MKLNTQLRTKLGGADIVALHKFVSNWISLRRWERSIVPFSSPQIALDVALYATLMRLENRVIPAKGAHLAVVHSADRVREIVSMLVADGWICRKSHPADGRVRLLEATDQLLALMVEYRKGALPYITRGSGQEEAPIMRLSSMPAGDAYG